MQIHEIFTPRIFTIYTHSRRLRMHITGTRLESSLYYYICVFIRQVNNESWEKTHGIGHDDRSWFEGLLTDTELVPDITHCLISMESGSLRKHWRLHSRRQKIQHHKVRKWSGGIVQDGGKTAIDAKVGRKHDLEINIHKSKVWWYGERRRKVGKDKALQILGQHRNGTDNEWRR